MGSKRNRPGDKLGFVRFKGHAMGGYFEPWRRKFGVLTLGLACVFMVAWVRSFLIHDVIMFDSSFEQGVLAGIVTTRNSVNVMAYEMSDAGVNFDDTLPTNVHDVPQTFPFFTRVYESKALLRIVNQGSDPTTPSLKPMPVLVIPYWSIVIPLTLLSAWLLFSKPRAKKTPEIKLAEN